MLYTRARAACLRARAKDPFCRGLKARWVGSIHGQHAQYRDAGAMMSRAPQPPRNWDPSWYTPSSLRSDQAVSSPPSPAGDPPLGGRPRSRSLFGPRHHLSLTPSRARVHGSARPAGFRSAALMIITTRRFRMEKREPFQGNKGRAFAHARGYCPAPAAVLHGAWLARWIQAAATACVCVRYLLLPSSSSSSSSVDRCHHRVQLFFPSFFFGDACRSSSAFCLGSQGPCINHHLVLIIRGRDCYGSPETAPSALRTYASDPREGAASARGQRCMHAPG